MLKIILFSFIAFFHTQSLAGDIARIITSEGTISIRFNRADFPLTVQNFENLASGASPFKQRDGKKITNTPFYDGQNFFRVHPDLGIFSGCPLGDGTGWSGYQIAPENLSESFFGKPGVVAMASPDSKFFSSQFFITTKALPSLEKKYNIIGHVEVGMEIVHKIAKKPTNKLMRPKQGIKIIRIEIVDSAE